jgi:hypothetical protein
VHGNAVIGDDCIIGQRSGSALNVGAGAKVLGRASAGDHAVIGADGVPRCGLWRLPTTTGAPKAGRQAHRVGWVSVASRVTPTGRAAVAEMRMRWQSTIVERQARGDPLARSTELTRMAFTIRRP